MNSNASPQAATAACTWAPAKSASNSTPSRRPSGRAGLLTARTGNMTTCRFDSLGTLGGYVAAGTGDLA